MSATTTRVRIAVAIDRDGNWAAAGASALSEYDAATFASEELETNTSLRWVEADVPMPHPPTVEGKVVP